MKLVRLIYASRFKEAEFDASELAKINHKSSSNNEKNEITGVLIFGNDYFLQCLEGERDVVSWVFSKIQKDPRHSEVCLIGFEYINQRDFAEWNMRLILLTEEKKHLVRQFSVSGEFNPYHMKPRSAVELMLALKK